MSKQPFRYVGFGVCPKCGKPIVRNAECTVGVCTCSSAVKVPLKPAMLWRNNARLYKKLEKIAKMLGIEVQELVDKTFETALNDKEFMDDAIKQLQKGCR